MSLVLATDAPGGEPGSEARAEPEIFASLQGEGPSLGRPSIFVRLSRCNLACVWCDTAYTWHFAGDNRPHRSGMTFERKANQVTLDENDVADRILALDGDRLVVTGGEPLLQATALDCVIERLKASRDFHVEIETNGTVAVPPSLDTRIDQYNVSPKLAHSGNPADLALIPERLREWAANPRAFFKFVVADEADARAALALARQYEVPPDRLFLMPEGTDSETLHARARWLVPLCQDAGVRYTDRLHIHAFGDTRGT